MLRSVRLARRCCSLVLQTDRVLPHPWYVSRKRIAHDAGEDGGERDANVRAESLRVEDNAGFGLGARVAVQGYLDEHRDEDIDETESESESDEEEHGAIGVDSEFDSESEEEVEVQEAKEEAEAQNQLLLIPDEALSDSETEEVVHAPGTSYLHKLSVPEVGKLLRKTRAIDLKILNVQARCQWTDYMVFATGKSTRHIRGMADMIVSRVKKKSTEDNHMDFPTVEGRNCNDWMAVDCGHIVVHVFSQEARVRYNLERKWGGEEVILDEQNAQQQQEEEERQQAMIKERIAAASAPVNSKKKEKKKKSKNKKKPPPNLAPLVLC